MSIVAAAGATGWQPAGWWESDPATLAWWPFKTDLLDHSGNGNHAVPYGGAYLGGSPTSLRLPPLYSYCTCGLIPEACWYQLFVSVWVYNDLTYPPVTAQGAGIIGKWLDISPSWQLWINGSTLMPTFTIFTPTGQYDAVASTSFADNIGWHMYSARYTSVSLSLFVDGVTQTGEVPASGKINDGDPDDQVKIGTYKFDGDWLLRPVGESFIIRSAPSDMGIVSLYDGTKARYGVG